MKKGRTDQIANGVVLNGQIHTKRRIPTSTNNIEYNLLLLIYLIYKLVL